MKWDPADAPAGRYTFIRVRRWAADDTLQPAGGDGTQVVEVEGRRWRAADGSGRVTPARPGSGTGRPRAAPTTVRVAWPAWCPSR